MKWNYTLWCEKLARQVTVWVGSSLAFVLAILSIVVWLLFGPFCNYSDTWQLVVNTITTLITFLMVFLIQRTQNKDSLAIQLKLNELIASIEGSSNRLLNIEDLSEQEIEILRKRYKSLAHRTRGEDNKTTRHTVEEIDD
jgi:low affinity Fe/Cu permease